MKKLAKKFIEFSAIIIIASILFCLSSPLLSSGSLDAACESKIGSSVHDSKMSGNAACAEKHSEMIRYAFNFVFSFNILASILVVVVVFYGFFSRKSLTLSMESYLIKLNFYWHKHRILIKPKLNKIYLRWFNLIGGAVALSL